MDTDGQKWIYFNYLIKIIFRDHSEASYGIHNSKLLFQQIDRIICKFKSEAQIASRLYLKCLTNIHNSKKCTKWKISCSAQKIRFLLTFESEALSQELTSMPLGQLKFTYANNTIDDSL